MGDTKPKTCSRCGIEKEISKFLKHCNICKTCENARKKQEYYAEVTVAEKTCNICQQTKPVDSFLRNRILCKSCNNEKRRNKYNSDEEHREKLIQMASIFKHEKVLERRKKKENEIGKDNKKCRNCSTIKSKDMFRHNRLKCKVCERDEPIDKMKRSIRCRIWEALNRKKENHTIHYLGCDSKTYFNWILSYNENYTIENRGKIWHIDHVIPLSLFNLENPDEQLIAFNWRNTMPLSAKENLAKNNRILTPQVNEHYHHLIKYNENNKIDMPEVFNELFAKHLVAGIPLEPSLPLTNGNICEELG